VTCLSLRTTSGARQSPPKGRLRNGLLEESACRRGMRRDIEDPRRPLPSKAHVQRSAVSVGFAAERLTGTRGTLKARVDHSIVRSRTTTMADVDHSHRGAEGDIEGARRSFPPARSGLFEPSNHLGCPSVAPEGETAERVARGVGLPAWFRGGHRRSTSITPVVRSRKASRIDVDHSHRRLTSNVPQSPSASPPGD
jgi:hypothetical protein